MLAWTLTLAVLAANPHLDQGRALYEKLEYQQASTALTLATQTSEGPELTEAFDLLARCQAAMGDARAAERTYSALLTREPHAREPAQASPKIRAAFLKAKQRLYPEDFVALEPLATSSGSLDLRVVDPWGRVKELRLYPEEGDAVPLIVEDHRARWSAPQGGRVSVEALDGAGRVVAKLGRPTPLTLAPANLVPPDRPNDGSLPTALQASVRPWHSRLPAWVAVAGAVVLAGTGTVLALQSAADSRAAEEADYGSETRALDASARTKALWANILVGASLAGGGTAVVLFVWD
jgi:hypothetical protein